MISILTTDRYWPWNGKNRDAEDRIWGALNEALGIPFLLLRMLEPRQGRDHDRAGEVIDGRRLSLREVGFLVSAIVRSAMSALRHRNMRFMLFVWSRSRLPSLVWYRTYAVLRDHLEGGSTRLLIFHGEFNSWGRAVAWACRDAGVVAVAWQHGVASALPPIPYREKDGFLPLPDHLILWSESSAAQNRGLIGHHVPWSIGGTKRLMTPFRTFSKPSSPRILVCPSTPDFKELLGLARRLKPENLQGETAFRTHPLRTVEEDGLPGWVLDEGDVTESLLRASVVIAGTSGIVIEALRLQIPVLIPVFLPSLRESPFAVSRPGIHCCASEYEIYAACERLMRGELGDRSAYHLTARYFAEDLKVVEVRQLLENLLSETVCL